MASKITYNKRNKLLFEQLNSFKSKYRYREVEAHRHVYKSLVILAGF